MTPEQKLEMLNKLDEILKTTPEEKLEVIDKTLNEVGKKAFKPETSYKSERDLLLTQLEVYVKLNFELAIAYEHNEQKARRYRKKAERTLDELIEQCKQELDSYDKKYIDNFLKCNQILYFELLYERDKLEDEILLYQKIKQADSISKKRMAYYELTKGIDSNRFKFHYPKITQELESAIRSANQRLKTKKR